MAFFLTWNVYRNTFRWAVFVILEKDSKQAAMSVQFDPRA